MVATAFPLHGFLRGVVVGLLIVGAFCLVWRYKH